MRLWLHRLALQVYRRMPTRVRRMAVRRVTPSFTVGSMCVIERTDGRMLLIRHVYRRRWGIPGGLLQRHETAADAARREVLEEVGLDIELIGEPMVNVDADPRRVDIVFRARPVDDATADDARPCSVEVIEVRWFGPTELPELQFETAQAIQALARASYAPPARPLLA
ncbi:MAG TPA: NUDIX domain-containing protein [Acidimicrobiales bacterium]|nr:NUDIX domain-containing protein [Acidimicrobiales bacterium]